VLKILNLPLNFSTFFDRKFGILDEVYTTIRFCNSFQTAEHLRGRGHHGPTWTPLSAVILHKDWASSQISQNVLIVMCSLAADCVHRNIVVVRRLFDQWT